MNEKVWNYESKQRISKNPQKEKKNEKKERKEDRAALLTASRVTGSLNPGPTDHYTTGYFNSLNQPKP